MFPSFPVKLLISSSSPIITIDTIAISSSCKGIPILPFIKLNNGQVISSGSTGQGFDSYNDYKLSGQTFLSVPNKNFTCGNIAIGYQALCSNTTGCYNGAIGYQALCSNTTGCGNIATGYQALSKNTIGCWNIANGYRALSSNISGCDNIALGSGALQNNTTACYNIAIGCQALYCNTTTSNNIALGYKALRCNSGYGNFAAGNIVLTNNTSGSSNIGIGSCALCANTTGCNNIAMGNQTLSINCTGCDNIAMGNNSLTCNKIGLHNIGLGCFSLYCNTRGNCNNSVGANNLKNNISGSTNIAIGTCVLFSNTIGCNNIALGYQTLYENTKGNNNIANGFCSLYANVSGNSNIGFGYKTLKSNILGCYNIAIGECAGYNETGSNKLYISNSSTNYPLIYGDFNSRCLINYGSFYSTGTSKANIISGSTCLFTPVIIGGTVAGSSITYKSTTGAGTAAGIAHQFKGGTDGGTVAMTLLNNGNVGIGTTAPWTKLAINTQSEAATATPLALSLGGTYGNLTVGKNLKLKFFDDNITTDNYGFGISAGLLEITAGNAADFAFFSDKATTPVELMRIKENGNVGIGLTAPTARLHIKSGSTAACTAPIKFNSGALMSVAEVGAHEFLTDDYYLTITTGAARKGIVLNDGTNLTTGRIPYVTTNGRLTDNNKLAYSTISGLTVGSNVIICGSLKITGVTNGTCSNSALVWDSGTCLIKKVPYISGGTGLSEYTITGNSSSTGFTVIHNKNKQFVAVEIVRNLTPYPTVYTNIYRTNANCVCVTFDIPPINGLQYKVLVTG